MQISALPPDETPTQEQEVTQATPTQEATAESEHPLVPLEDLAALERVLLRIYTDTDRELMQKGVAETRNELLALRHADLPETLAPAFHFEPRPATWTPPSGLPHCHIPRPHRLEKFSGTSEAWEELAFTPIMHLAEWVRIGAVTSTQLTQFFLERLKRLDEKLHCVVNFTEARALEHSAKADAEIAGGKYRGPLHGIPYGAKDLFAVRDYPTTWGAEPYRTQQFDYNATVIERLDAAGAILIAKLTLGELAMDDGWFGGQTLCPWNLERGSSGSSAGSGAAVAAGGVPFALGTETLGSIVSPSVRNGTTGLRPSFGRVPRTGAMPLSWTLDKIGPMTRTVDDCALVFDAINGPDGYDPTVRAVAFRYNAHMPLHKLRVGLDIAAWEQLAKDEARKPLYDTALAQLKEMGCELFPVTLPRRSPEYDALAGIIIGVEGAAMFQQLNQEGGFAKLRGQGANNWPNLLRVGSLIPASDYVNAQRIRSRLCVEMAQVFEGVDVILTVPLTGPGIYWTNLSGHPSLTTRCGRIGDVPQMLEFWGKLDGEADILRLASAYEAVAQQSKDWPRL